MKAYLCVRDDDRPLAVRPWLYRVAHNAALNAVEKKGSDWEQLDENYDGVPQPPQVAEQRARFLQIVGEIDALPARQRQALVLNEFEGRCYADIAAQLGTSESGVRGLLRRARRQLRETAAAVLLPIPVLRELVRSDGGRGAGELIGTAGAAGGVERRRRVREVGGRRPRRGHDRRRGDSHPAERRAAGAHPTRRRRPTSPRLSARTSPRLSAASWLRPRKRRPDRTPSAASPQTGAQLAAGAGLQSPSGGGTGGGIEGIESEPRNTAQPVETVESPSLLPVEPLTPIKDDAEEEPAEEKQGDEAPASGEDAGRRHRELGVHGSAARPPTSSPAPTSTPHTPRTPSRTRSPRRQSFRS